MYENFFNIILPPVVTPGPREHNQQFHCHAQQ